MLQTKFQASVSEDDNFQCKSMVQTQDPMGRGHFEPGGYHLNKLGKGPLGNATYPISSTWP